MHRLSQEVVVNKGETLIDIRYKACKLALDAVKQEIHSDRRDAKMSILKWTNYFVKYLIAGDNSYR